MRHMKPRKVGGKRLEQFFTRFYAADPGLPKAAIDNLVRRSVLTFTSVRVRPGARLMLGMPGGQMHPGETAVPVKPRAPMPPPQRPANDAPQPSPAPAPTPTDAAFDPYAIGLVPTFQREGRAGLLTKLMTVNDRAQLRQIARAQQIALEAKFKSDDAELHVLRNAIADAVEKRIKDRQSARE
jgi:hypothetical protein